MAAKQQIEQPAKDGQPQHQQQPGNFIGGIIPPQNNDQCHNHTDEGKGRVNINIMIAEVKDGRHKNAQLNQDQQGDDGGTAQQHFQQRNISPFLFK